MELWTIRNGWLKSEVSALPSLAMEILIFLLDTVCHLASFSQDQHMVLDLFCCSFESTSPLKSLYWCQKRAKGVSWCCLVRYAVDILWVLEMMLELMLILWWWLDALLVGGTGVVDLQVPVELTVRRASLGSSARKSSPTSYQVKLDLGLLLTVGSLENVQRDTVKYKHLNLNIVNLECNGVFHSAIHTDV